MYGLKKTSQILPMNFCIVLYIETITVSIFFYIKTIIVNDLVSFLNLFPLKSQYLLTAEKVLLVHVLYNHYVPATDYMCTCKDIVEISFYYNALLIKILYSSISTFLKLVKNSLWRNTFKNFKNRNKTKLTYIWYLSVHIILLEYKFIFVNQVHVKS